jgi:hypothetical protein
MGANNMTRRLRRRDGQVIKKTQSVPTEKDWGNYLADLDEKHAHSVFSGRTNEEAQGIFKRNPIEGADGLRWMPEIPFRYYILGFRDAVIAPDFGRLYLSDAASCFLGLIAEKLERHPRTILPIMPELLPAAEYVAKNQVKFEAEERIYGNFTQKLAHIQNLYSAQR